MRQWWLALLALVVALVALLLVMWHMIGHDADRLSRGGSAGRGPDAPGQEEGPPRTSGETPEKGAAKGNDTESPALSSSRSRRPGRDAARDAARDPHAGERTADWERGKRTQGAGGPVMVTDPTGTLSVYDDFPTTLNPLFARTMADLRAAELVFDRLFFRNTITNEVDSRLVWRSEGLDGGRRVQLYVEEGIRWHDGTPFGPEDVCCTVEAILLKEQKGEYWWTDLAGCTFDEDAHTATIDLAHPHHDVFDRLSFPVLP
ncbi:MAG: hypothetical protein JRJ84_15240, partial [Deltaproteobacteria bacterium]|nr:hypothetical protein [Deltaproteobacteria bacterium]